MLNIWLMLLLFAPLAGGFINGLRWRRGNIKSAAFIGVTACFISFLSFLQKITDHFTVKCLKEIFMGFKKYANRRV